MALDKSNIYISTPLHKEPSLRILAGKLFRGGAETLGELAALTEDDFKKGPFKTTPGNLQKIKNILAEYGYTLTSRSPSAPSAPASPSSPPAATP